MYSRFSWLALLSILLVGPEAAWSEPAVGGHELELSIVGAHVDFAEEIRFEDDSAVGLRFMAGLSSWWQLGVQLDHIGARDPSGNQWQDVLVASVQSRFELRPNSPWSPSVGIGVSFMAFENAPELDAVAEGLDLGLGIRWAVDSRWTIRAELLGRVQTFTVTEVDSQGVPTGAPEETGYRWTRLWQLGVGRAF